MVATTKLIATQPLKCQKCGRVYVLGLDTICITSEETTHMFGGVVGKMPSSLMISHAKDSTDARLIEEAYGTILRLGKTRGWDCGSCYHHNHWGPLSRQKET